MTYKLNSSVFEKIVSPVVLVIDGSRKEYRSGVEACSDVFDKRYVVDSMKGSGEAIEVVLKVAENNKVDWENEETVDFF